MTKSEHKEAYYRCTICCARFTRREKSANAQYLSKCTPCIRAPKRVRCRPIGFEEWFGLESLIGASHTPEIVKGTYQIGTIVPPMEYNK